MEHARIGNTTAAIFIDDGGDDAHEFKTNYIWFDPSDPLDRLRAWDQAWDLWEQRQRRLLPGSSYRIAEPRLCGSGSENWESAALLLQTA